MSMKTIQLNDESLEIINTLKDKIDNSPEVFEAEQTVDVHVDGKVETVNFVFRES